jgi:ligand-binding sensor domain-containing protein/two-component sensor histidine kinase
MPSIRATAIFRLAAGALGLWLMAVGQAEGERLPVKLYTTADGLAHNSVNRIVRDSRGFLWFCTFEGLSRFDGYRFTTYGTDQGLPSQVVNDLLETREGQYWVATGAGLCRFDPKGIAAQHAINGAPQAAAPGAMFTAYFPGDDAKSKEVTSLLQDHAGAIWCGTAKGLYRLEQPAEQVRFQFIELGMPTIYGEGKNVVSMIEDRRGALLIGSTNGLYRWLPDGQIEHYDEHHGLPLRFVYSLLADREGHLWVGAQFVTLCRLVFDLDPTRPGGDRAYSIKEGLPTAIIHQLIQASDGSLWAGSSKGLIRFIPTADGSDFRFRIYGLPHGLSSQDVQALAEDRSGNLWVGMANGGAAKLARSGITAYGEADGMKGARAIFKDQAEGLNVITIPSEKEYLINRFDGERFTAIRPRFPQPTYLGWGWNQLMLEDRSGEWWAATGNGLYRFPKVNRFDRLARTLPKAVYTTRDGLASNDILRLFEDSRSDIWVGTANGGGLSRWERATETFHHYTDADGLPSLVNFYPISLAEDRAGNIWIGFSNGGGLARYRQGRFTHFTAADELAEGGIFNLFVDSAGRLWAPTTRGGLCRIDHPEAERPTIVTYTTADGLSSDDVKAVTEDRWGRIYLGTGRGIDRLDPATGHVRHYTANEGALLGDVNAALQDRDGTLWFSFATGLVRLVPEPDAPPLPPPVLIIGLRIAGDAQPVSALGETEVAPVELAASKNQLQIDFVALGFSPGEGLRYQYKIEGAQPDWSLPSDQRTVNFANLAPGHYRFLVRAVNADGVMSAPPASFSFTILPPIWQRWWVVTMVALLVTGVAYALYRYRVMRLLELERVRARIAGDLHDDIGANLTKIAILSEVAHQQLGFDDSPADHTLSSIADISRESVASMRDIVWAINPKRDRLLDLTRRMRSFASDIFTSRNIEFRFSTPDRDRELRLDPEIRRDVFLIFKEAVNNLLRHSGCAKAVIDLVVEGGWLVLTVSDDGKGVDLQVAEAGHGFSSMRRRAESFGGQLEIISPNGSGTTVRLKVPLGRPLFKEATRLSAAARKAGKEPS